MKFIHGGDIYSREILYDFSANINPLGMPDNVRRALRDNISAFERYPDTECRELKRAIAKSEGVETDNIACGNGASDIIYRLVRTVKPNRAIIIGPTFSEYERALTKEDCKITAIMLSEENGFEVTDAVLTQIHDADMLFICNPNNPTGRVIKPEITAAIRRRCVENGILPVIDECFMDFVIDKEKYMSGTDKNTVIIKAFTKNYALAGLRLGYALCGNTELIRRIEDTGPCWSVSVPAQTAGAAALRDKEYLKKTARGIEAERQYLTAEMRNFGLKVYPSDANFILFRCGLPLDKLLLKEKIAVRPCADLAGLDNTYFRTAVRLRRENAALIGAVKKIMRGM